MTPSVALVVGRFSVNDACDWVTVIGKSLMHSQIDFKLPKKILSYQISTRSLLKGIHVVKGSNRNDGARK